MIEKHTKLITLKLTESQTDFLSSFDIKNKSEIVRRLINEKMSEATKTSHKQIN